MLPCRMGYSCTQVLDAGEMMAGSKPASSSCASLGQEPSLGVRGTSPRLSSPSPSQPKSKGKEK